MPWAPLLPETDQGFVMLRGSSGCYSEYEGHQIGRALAEDIRKQESRGLWQEKPHYASAWLAWANTNIHFPGMLGSALLVPEEKNLGVTCLLDENPFLPLPDYD